MKGDRNKAAIVYAIVNITNGKKYIGVTGRGLHRRWMEHKLLAKGGRPEPLYKAIRKYGHDAFECLVMKEFNTVDEALQGEIDFISSLKPDYNLALGGGGRLGVGLTDAGRKKIIETHTGNKYRLGQAHSNETKEFLRARAFTPNERERWSKYSSLGPASMARRVVCLDDNEQYESASAAASHYGVAKSALIELCLGRKYRKSVGGLRFSYVEKVH